MAQYQSTECLPSPLLSRHVECFWQLTLNENERQPALLPPQGIFDIVFSPNHVNFHQFDGKTFQVTKLQAGCWLTGQQTRSFYWQSPETTVLFGIRLKPFALFSTPLISPLEMKNSIVSLPQVSHLSQCDIQRYLETLFPQFAAKQPIPDIQIQRNTAEVFMCHLLNGDLSIPDEVRQLSNVILGNQGDIRLNELCDFFDVSKVTVRKKFLNKIGILPKELCQIWRLNAFLLLTHQQTILSATEASMMAGYYDQAHLTKEFKSVFHQSPSRFLKQASSIQLNSIAHIENRFRGSYDPRKC